MSKRYFIGDPHFGHKLVAATRGFFKEDVNGKVEVDIEAHDMAVMQSIFDTVPQGSEIVFMGDLSIDKDSEKALFLMKVLTLRGYLLKLRPGNHDRVHPLHGNKVEHYMPAFKAVFSEILERSMEKIWDRTVYFSHFPVIGDRGETRYAEWRFPLSVLDKENAWSVHAHTHQETIVDKSRPKHVCVSWDVMRRPISEDEIKRVVLGQAGKRSIEKRASWGAQEGYRALAEQVKNREVRI